MSLMLAMSVATGTLCAQTAPDLPERGIFGGVQVSDVGFTAGSGDFTLELTGEAGVEIRVFTTDRTKLLSYTPTTSGTLRLVKKSGVVYAYENGSYVTTATETDVVLPTVDDATVASSSDQLLTNPQLRTETADESLYQVLDFYQWQADVTYSDNFSVWTTGVGDNYTVRFNATVEGTDEAWAENDHYLTQQLNSIKPNTLYVFRFSQVWYDANAIAAQAGLGATAGAVDYASASFSIGADQNGVHEYTILTPNTFTEGDDVYFSFRTVGTSVLFESEIDWVSLQEVTANNSAFGTARYLEGKTYAPATLPGTVLDGVIANPSFEDDADETYTPQGWTLSASSGWSAYGARAFDTDFMDGTYVLNMWCSEIANALPVTAQQDITLNEGAYVLSALVTADADNTVSLFAGSYKKNAKMDNNGDIFQETYVPFYVDADNTTVTIGVTSATNWFKADNFVLRKVEGVTKDEFIEPYTFVASEWVTGDATRVAQSNISYDTDDNTITVQASGQNNVCLNFVTNDINAVDASKRYIVIEGTNLSTALADSRMWYLNGNLEGDYAPLYRVSDKNNTFIVWDFDAAEKSIYGTLGEGSSFRNDVTLLQSDEGELNTLFGLTSTTGTSVITDINFYDDLSDVEGFAKAQAYTRLASLVSAATTVSATLSHSAFNETVVATFNTAIGNAQDALDAEDDGSLAATYYQTAISNLQTAINTALYQAGVAVDVTDIYLDNPSYANGYAEPWTIADGDAYDSKLYQSGDWHVAANTDADGIMYNLYGQATVAGQMLQTTAFAAAKGKYRTTASLASDNGNQIKMVAGSMQTTVSITTDANTFASYQSDVLDLSAAEQTISVGAVSDASWFKSDNFHLLYLPIADKTELKNVYQTALNVDDVTGVNAALETAMGTAWTIISNPAATEAQVADALSSLRSALQSSFTAVSVPLTSVGTTPADGEFFLYNFATKTYLNFGSEWGSRAIAGDYRGDAGILLTLANEGGATDRYTITTGTIYNDGYLFASDGNGVYVDGDATINTWAAMPWTFTEVPGLEGKNVYRLQRADYDKNATDYYLTLGDGTYDHVVCCVEQGEWQNELNSYWMLVSKQQRVDSLALATVSNPVNASFYIDNPDMEGNGDYSATVKSWTHTGTTHAQTANQYSFYVDRSMEEWHANNTYNFYQTLADLKPGLYKLTAFGFYSHGPQEQYGGDHAVSGTTDHHRGKEEFPMLYANNGTSNYATPVISAFRDGKDYEQYCIDNGITPVGVHAYWNEWNGLYNYDYVFWDYGYVPDNSGNVHEMFLPGFWNDNAVLLNVLDEGEGTGNLTIGVRQDFTVENDHAVFDHFRLYYLGAANEDYATAYNAYRNQRMDTQRVTDDDFDYAELRDTAYVSGGTKVYQTALKSALATAESVFATTNTTMTSADATTLAAATEALRVATEKCRLQFRLAEFNDFFEAVQTLDGQNSKTPAGVTVEDHASAVTTFHTAVQAAETLVNNALDAISDENDADLMIQYVQDIINMDATLHTAVEAYIAKADPMDDNVFDLTAILKRPDMTGIESWADPEIYGWLTNQNGFSRDATPFRNFNIHANNNLYQNEPAYFGECFVFEDVDLDQGWAIYQKFHLPAGEYRFSAASFSSDGNEGNTKPTDNGYLAVGDDDATNLQKSLIPAGFLTDNTVAFTVSDAMGASTDSLNLGIYMTNEGTRANWVGLGYMHLYKIPSVSIRENLTYVPYRNQESAEHMDDYENVFNFTDQAKLSLYRNFPTATGRWATLCLPCNMTEDQVKEVFGPNVIVNWFSKYDIQLFDDDPRSNATDGDFGAIVTLTFEDPTDEDSYCHDTYLENPYLVCANKPVLIMINDTDYLQTNRRDALGNVDLGEDNKNIGWYDLGSARAEHIDDPDDARFNPADMDSSIDTTNGTFTFVGVYDGTGDTNELPAGNVAPDEGGFIIPQPTATTASYYLSNTSNVEGDDSYLPEAHFRYVGDRTTQRMRGMRGYFEYEGPSAAIKAGRINLSINGGKATAINNVKADKNENSSRQGVYNISGQRVADSSDSLNQLPKGVYVVNGKKVIVK